MNSISFPRLIVTCALAWTAVLPQAADRDWPSFYGDEARSHYSTLKQITPRNVHRLEVAWTYRCGDSRTNNLSQIQCNPVVVDGVIYGTSPQLKLFAVDAATGRELWRFNPFPTSRATGVNRGVVFWKEGEDRRILLIVDHFLYAVDVRTGRLIESFGEHGRVDIKLGLGRDVSKLSVQGSTPGAITWAQSRATGTDWTLVFNTRTWAPGTVKPFDDLTTAINAELARLGM
jgi:quinoprotein glucose dehydrogenase